MQISEYSVNNHINSILKAEKETYYIDRERERNKTNNNENEPNRIRKQNRS